MVNARRAKARPSRVIVPVLAAVALLGAGGFAVAQLGSDSGTTVVGPSVTPSVAATQATTTASDAPSSADPTASGPAAADDLAQRALTECRAKVRAGDQVLETAATGVQDWATHVQAQTDANSSKITATEMEGEFKQTRLAGPRDQKRYADAVSAYDRQDGSCAAVADASKTTKTALARCAARDKAQQPVMEAAGPAMADWKSHLSAMQRSRQGHVENAQATWLRAWRRAPKNLDAYAKAAADFDAPRC